MDLPYRAGVVGAALAIVYFLVRPQRPPRASSAEVLELVGRSYATAMRAAMGGTSPDACNRECWWPGLDYAWILIRCPLRPGHDGMHGDINWAPLFDDELAEWMNEQHRVSS
jgi:hypothetical protein